VVHRTAGRLLGAGVSIACLFVPAATAAGSTQTSIVSHVNEVRVQRHLPRLTINPSLAQAAAAHCTEMLSGQGLTHGSLEARLRQYVSAGTYGETIAWMPIGAASAPGAVVRAWMSSPPHRAVLLSRRFHQIGVAAQRGNLGSQRGTSFTVDVAS
jgi:uncharacterized protein YkwD